MAESTFIDYYKLLQVHYDASPEVIHAAYLKLSKSFHPDSSPAETAHMALLNEAFTTLGDSRKRAEYHKKWLEYAIGNDSEGAVLNEKGILPNDATIIAAQEALNLFFRFLSVREWNSAYDLLTADDKRKTRPEDFIAWREAVVLCSEITNYEITYMRSFHDCRLEGVLYRHVVEFTVAVTEVDTLTLEPRTEKIRKCCAYDGASWRIWLGISNVKSSALRYRMQAERNQSIDPMALYHSAVNKIDPLTGLYSELGFYAECEKEVARTRRYNNPITIIAFQLRCPEKERETACLCQLASIIHDGKRLTDIATRLDNDQIVCLLTETRKYSGDLAARKFLKLISEKRSENFDVSFGVVFYNGTTDIKEAVLTACSIADNNNSGM